MAEHVLMLSSSRQGTEPFLYHAQQMIAQHLGECRSVLFIPFAGVTRNWDDYVEAVKDALPDIDVTGIHTTSDPVAAIKQAKANNQAILVGGGNTFNLLTQLYLQSLIAPLKEAIANGTVYIGWSAGSNICGATIRTTNDMPIIAPPSFDALGVLPCQLNPHYTDYQPPGHNGETRDERLAEFTKLEPDTPVLAIREGSALVLRNGTLSLLGEKEGYVFLGDSKKTITADDNLNEFINRTGQ